MRRFWPARNGYAAFKQCCGEWPALRGDVENETWKTTSIGPLSKDWAHRPGSACSGNGHFNFYLLSSSVNEFEDEATITVIYTPGEEDASTVMVDYYTEDGTATADDDYTPIAEPATLTFTAEQHTQTITVPIIDDSIVEDDETVYLWLTNPVGGPSISSPCSPAVLTIIDDDDEGPTIDFLFERVQWADTVVDYSSQASSTDNSAEQALGRPDTSEYGDAPTAWSPSPEAASTSYITLDSRCRCTLRV